MKRRGRRLAGTLGLALFASPPRGQGPVLPVDDPIAAAALVSHGSEDLDVSLVQGLLTRLAQPSWRTTEGPRGSAIMGLVSRLASGPDRQRRLAWFLDNPDATVRESAARVLLALDSQPLYVECSILVPLLGDGADDVQHLLAEFLPRRDHEKTIPLLTARLWDPAPRTRLRALLMWRTLVPGADLSPEQIEAGLCDPVIGWAGMAARLANKMGLRVAPAAPALIRVGPGLDPAQQALVLGVLARAGGAAAAPALPWLGAILAEPLGDVLSRPRRWGDTVVPAYARLGRWQAALEVAAALGPPGGPVLRSGLASSEPELLQIALIAAAQAKVSAADLRDQLVRLVAHADPRVRVEAAMTWHRLAQGSAEAAADAACGMAPLLADPDRSVRYRVLGCLPYLRPPGTPSLADAVIDLVGRERDLLADATRALAAMKVGDPRTVAFLADVAARPENGADVQIEALRGLTGAGVAAPPALVERMLDQGDLVAWRLMELMVRNGHRVPADAVPAMIARAKDKLRVAAHTPSTALLVGLGEPALAAMMELLRDPNHVVAFTGKLLVATLGRQRPDVCARLLDRGTDGPDRVLVLGALADAPDYVAPNVPAVVRFLDDPDEDVRAPAFRVVCHTRSAAHAEAMVRRLTTDAVARRLKHELLYFGAAAAAPLARLLDDADYGDLALEVLLALGDDSASAWPRLVSAHRTRLAAEPARLGRDLARFRRRALDYLELLAPDDAALASCSVPVACGDIVSDCFTADPLRAARRFGRMVPGPQLIDQLTRIARDEDPGRRRSALLALEAAAAEDRQLAGVVAPTVIDADVEVRRAALAILTRRPAVTALVAPEVARAFLDPLPELREQALVALAATGTALPASLRPALEIAAQDSTPAVRDRAKALLDEMARRK